MKYAKDDPRGYKPLPRNDGKFVLDGKRVEFSDYGGSSKTASSRLNTIETDFYVLEADTNDRLDRIESEIKVMHHVVGKNILALDEIEKRIAIMQEKINGID